MRRFSAFFLILFCLAVTSAGPRPNELTKKFVGAWRLVSIEGNFPGRTNSYDWPTGLIMYDPSGRICVNKESKSNLSGTSSVFCGCVETLFILENSGSPVPYSQI